MAISTSIRYSFLVLNLLLLCSGLASLATGLFFSSTTEARRNAVVSPGNLLSLTVGGGLITVTGILGCVAYWNPMRFRRAISVYCLLVISLALTCIGLGVGIWYQTLTMHDDSGDYWRTSWSYNLRKSFQEFSPDAPCCGFTSPRDAPAITDVCFEQSALPGCQDLVFTYADSYLRNIYTFIFGLTVLDAIVFLMAVIFLQAVNDEVRFEKMARKLFAQQQQQPSQGHPQAGESKDSGMHGYVMPPRI
jgi:hypothetical protein